LATIFLRKINYFDLFNATFHIFIKNLFKFGEKIVVIGVFDSGIGGLSVLYKLSKKFTNTTFIYLGDNANAPYGNRGIFDLKTLFCKNVHELLKYSPDFIVVACNTLSCNVLFELKKIFKTPIYGVFPPIEREIICGRKTLLLCTPQTANAYKRYSKIIQILPIDGLVNKIEQNPFDLSKISIKKYLPTTFCGLDSIILGCTHYFFVKIGIADHFKINQIYDGGDLTVDYLFDICKNQKCKEKSNENKYIFIGDEKHVNSEVFFKVVVGGKNI
jgi:glutamate racemase